MQSGESVAKGQAKGLQAKGKGRQQEEVLPPQAAASDHNEASEDGDKGALVSSTTPPPILTQGFLDKLDNDEPLSAIKDDDPDPFGVRARASAAIATRLGCVTYGFTRDSVFPSLANQERQQLI